MRYPSVCSSKENEPIHMDYPSLSSVSLLCCRSATLQLFQNGCVLHVHCDVWRKHPCAMHAPEGNVSRSSARAHIQSCGAKEIPVAIRRRQGILHHELIHSSSLQLLRL